MGETMKDTRMMVTVLYGVALACHREPAVQFEPHEIISRTTGVGAAPMFAVSATGKRAAAWVSAPGGGTDGRLYVSINGAAPVEVTDPLGPIVAHSEAPPKLSFGQHDELYVAYVVGRVIPGKRFPESALRFRRSADGGKTWGAPVGVTDDSDFGSHHFHAMHVAADGSIYIVWLDGREGKSGAYLTRSNNGGTTWEKNRRIDVGEACPCCRTAIASASDGTLYVAWRKVFPGDVRDVVVSSSRDGGLTWSIPQRVYHDNWIFAGCPHAGPSLAVGANGELHVSWWTGEPSRAGVYYTASTDGGRTFRPPTVLAAKVAQAVHVQMAVRDSFAAVTWDDPTGESPRVVLRLSRDGGQNFSAPVTVSNPAHTATYPVLAMTTREIVLAWADGGRSVVQPSSHNMGSEKESHHQMGLSSVGANQIIARTGTLQ
jgi:hypothetical protein